MSIRAWLQRAEQRLLDLIYPRKTVCLCCAERSCGEYICQECRQHLDDLRLEDTVLRDAGMTIDAADVRVVWHYRDEAMQLIRQLKYQCVRDAAEVMADAVAQEARRMELPEGTIVTSVAMPARRIRQRGIDHGRVLAEAVAQRLGLPYECLLIRAPGGHTQRGLKREQRIRNLSGRFTGVPQAGRPVLLIDDVLTTGATASVCTRALINAGSGPVRVIAAARVSGRRNGYV